MNRQLVLRPELLTTGLANGASDLQPIGGCSGMELGEMDSQRRLSAEPLVAWAAIPCFARGVFSRKGPPSGKESTGRFAAGGAGSSR